MDEQRRLAAVRALGQLDSAPEPAFDDLTRLAAQTLGAPIATLSLVDAERQWMKSVLGVHPRETARTESFCHHTIQGDDVLVVEDARTDPRFRDLPLVRDDDGVRFYAGAPVRLSNGAAVGAVCVLDRRPRTVLDDGQKALLKSLAAAASSLFELRREVVLRRAAETALDERARLLDLAEEMAQVGHWKLDFATNRIFFSPAVYRIHGVDASGFDPNLDSALDFYLPADRARVAMLVERAGTHGEDYGFEAKLRRRCDGALRDVVSQGRVERDGEGRPRGLFGVFRDVTEERRALAVIETARHKAEADAVRLRRLATTDPLTGVMNRRAFVDRVEAAIAQSPEGLHTLAVLDIDHFKAINDTYGHDVGDEVLRSFAHRCEEALERVGAFGRLGGEEFGLLVSGLGELNARPLVARLHTAVSAATIDVGRHKLRVTFSVGLTQAKRGEAWRALFARADGALYEAKRQGRNRLIAA